MPRKAAASSKPQKLLSQSKVLRVLEAMKVDTARFLRMYEEIPTARGRAMREPDAREVKAVEEFSKSGDFAALRRALGDKPPQVAQAVVTRVIAFRAQEGRTR